VSRGAYDLSSAFGLDFDKPDDCCSLLGASTGCCNRTKFLTT
jgi:hypothetical protein